MLVVNNKLSIPLREFQFTYSRSSGPGGQNVNKLNTKVTLHWPVTESPSLPDGVRERFIAKNRRRINAEGELYLTSQRFRDQGRNVADCLAKLRDMLEEAMVKPTPRKATKPSKGAKRRRLKDKKAQSRAKQLRRPPGMED